MEIDQSVDSRNRWEKLKTICPYSEQIYSKAGEIFSDGIRAQKIYEMLELLAEDGRIDRNNFFGDVCCLDVSNEPQELVVFKVLGSKSLTAAEGYSPNKYILKTYPDIAYISKSNLDTLKQLESSSKDLICMFNIFHTFQTENERNLFLEELSRVLKKGGNAVITGDSGSAEIIHRMEKETVKIKNLSLGFPNNDREPMGWRGWVMRSILEENVLGFEYQDDDVDTSTTDANILVIEKVEG